MNGRAPVRHETIEGTVEATNQRGIRVQGEWYNVSQFHPVDLPSNGTYVRLEVDPKGFIRDIHTLPDETLEDETPAVLSHKDERITRLAVLKAAAYFGASRPDLKSSEVLMIAEKWLQWVEGA